MSRLMSGFFYVAMVLLLAGCGGGSSSSGTSSIANSVPVANAGVDQNLPTTSLVQLNGSGSTDADGDLLTYIWSITSKPAGSTTSLSSASTVNPSFTADVDGSYVVKLIVNDGTVNSAVDTVTITATTGNSAPIANAGTDQNIVTASTVTLNGSASSDADGDALTYSWSISSKPSSSDAILSDSTAVNPTFVADLDGSYVVQLIVNDGAVDSATATVTETASTPNTAPIATSSAFQTNEDQPINDVLNGTDSDGDPFTFIKITNTINGLVTIDSNGTFSYVPNTNYYGSDSFSYKVNDGQDDSAVQEVTITVNAVNDTPTVNDQNISLHSRQSYSGGISALDPENDNLIYTVNTAPTFGSFDIDANTGSFIYQPENNDGTTSVIVEITDGQYSVDTNLTFIVSTFDMENSIEICDSYKLYSNNFSIAAGLIQANSDVTINISNMIDNNLTVTSAILYNGDNTVITTFYENIIEPNYLLKLSGRYISDVTSFDNYWIIKYTDSLTGNNYISKYTYDSLENTSISSSVYINSTGTIGCYDDTPYHGTYVTESDLGFDIAPIDDVLVSSSKIIPLGLNDAIISNDANITVSISPTTGMSATYNDGNLTLQVIETEAQSNAYTVTVSAIKGLNQDIETFDVDYVVQHNVNTTSEFRSALLSAAGNGYSDIIMLADGTYSTTDDGLGSFTFSDNELNKLMLIGSAPENVILSGNNTHRVLYHNNSAEDIYDYNYITDTPNHTNTLQLQNITIQDGYVNDKGAGVYSNGDIYADNVSIKNNYTDNSSSFNNGGGIYTPADLFLNNSIVHGNAGYFGGGFFIGTHAEIRSSDIKSNMAYHSGGGFIAKYAQISNSIITFNTSSLVDYNGGAYHVYYTSSLVNSLVMNNNTGITMYSDTHYIINSVLENNGGFDVKNTDTASVIISNSFFNGVLNIPYTGANNLSSGNLGFLDEVNGDFRLTSTSVLIDSGRDSFNGIYIPADDIDGNPRPAGLTTDIGPYEYQP